MLDAYLPALYRVAVFRFCIYRRGLEPLTDPTRDSGINGLVY
jgi:hypothetical protein